VSRDAETMGASRNAAVLALLCAGILALSGGGGGNGAPRKDPRKDPGEITNSRRFLEQLEKGLIGFCSPNTYTPEIVRRSAIRCNDDDDRPKAWARERAALIQGCFSNRASFFQKVGWLHNSQLAPKIQQQLPPHVSITPWPHPSYSTW
jgi:hypothetical protein